MTREEAIKILKEYAPRVKPFYEPFRTEYPQAIKMAIESLSESNVHNLHSGDLISRKAAIDAISSMFAPTPVQKDMIEDCLEIIENVPSAEAKTGEWVREKRFYKSEYGLDFEYFIEHCSECGARRRIGWHGVAFCPNCGAKMRVE